MSLSETARTVGGDGPRNPAMPKPARVSAVDVARGCAVLWMVFVHAHFIYADEPTRESRFGSVFLFIGQGASVFLLVMGMSIALSRKQLFSFALRRSVQLFVVGCMFTTLWQVVPFMLGIFPDNYVAANRWTAPASDLSQAIRIAFTGDILHLAALGLCLVALVRRWIRSPYVFFFFAVLVAIASGPLRGFHSGVWLVDLAGRYLWTDTFASFFPVFPWSATLLLGMGAGLFLRRTDGDMRALLRVLLPLGLVLIVGGQGLMALDHNYHFGDFYHMGPGGALWLMGLSCALLGVAQFLCRWLDTYLLRFVLFCSQRVTGIYGIHLFLLSWGMGLVGFQQLGPMAVLTAGALVLVLSLLMDDALRRLVRRRREKSRKDTASNGHRMLA